MSGLSGENIVLAVTGGIAAYKSPDLVRRLRDAGAEVRVVMSRGAQAFVTPLTFQAVSGHPVHTRLLDESAEAGMGHIELARWADRVLIAPATADCIAKLAHGIADDLLTTLCLATEAPIAVAPAMNRVMWSADATRENVRILASRGVQVLGPGDGDQACGETGAGRMWEPVQITGALAAGKPLPGTAVLITAGPTREAIDPVRYIGNRSSGKMGFAVAEAAAALGAAVTLVAGPVALATPPGVRRLDVESASDMHRTVMNEVDNADIFIAVAAVADYRPSTVAAEKIKKDQAQRQIALERTTDILAAVADRQSAPFSVGFAAETHDLEAYAKEKLKRKQVDMIAANIVGRAGTGFAADENELLVITADSTHKIERTSKREAAAQLLQLIVDRYRNETDTA